MTCLLVAGVFLVVNPSNVSSCLKPVAADCFPWLRSIGQNLPTLGVQRHQHLLADHEPLQHDAGIALAMQQVSCHVFADAEAGHVCINLHSAWQVGQSSHFSYHWNDRVLV